MTTRRNLSLDEAAVDAQTRYASANPVSGDRYLAAANHMPGGNTRSVLHFSPYPLTMARGVAQHVWDVDEHQYTDFLGEYTAGLYGHSNPVILKAVREALDNGIVMGAPGLHETELSELICARFPSCDLVRFCNSGTEANLMALGAARASTGRSHVLVFDGGYHGGVLYFGNGASPVNAPYPTVIGIYNDLDATLARVQPHLHELAAILVEPMIGSGGGIAGSQAFLQGLRDLATEHGAALIFDEVMTSRLSGGGLQRKLGITPDLTSLGKYLGGGLTFGAFGGSEQFMGGFDPRRENPWPHAGTFNNNVLTMAAGVTGLRDIFTEAAAAELNARGDHLRQRMRDAAAARDVPVQVTGVGSILALHFQRTAIERPVDTQHTPIAARTLVHLEMIERGFIIARRGFMSLSLAITESDIDEFVSAFDDVLAANAALLTTIPG
ncbi:MAG: glutamate-1-semialdehyde 2,1-aminomutase [Gammaproteobacteria bacterium]|jgi:glutamate-1-semialdehyde 2,1-aminomutase